MNIGRVAFHVYALALSIISLLLFFPPVLYLRPGIGLDASWVLGLHLALRNSFIFGKDFVFNYGPLGFIATRLPIGVGRTWYLLCDAFLFCNVAFVLFYLLRTLKTYWSFAFVFLTAFVVTAVLGPPVFGETLAFWLFLFMLYHYITHRSALTLLLAAALSIILLYFKINFGLVSVVLFYGFLLYSCLKSQTRNLFAIACAAMYPITIYVTSGFLKTDLWGYLLAGIDLIDGDNDAMSLDVLVASHPEYLYMAGLILLVFCLSLAVHVTTIIRNQRSTGVLCLLTILAIYLLFKQAFVRADAHVYIFFAYIPLMIGLLYVFSSNPVKQSLSKVLMVTLIFSFGLSSQSFRYEHIANCWANIRSYLTAAANVDSHKWDDFGPFGKQGVTTEYFGDDRERKRRHHSV